MLEVGRVGRAHGLRGDVVLDLVSNRAERSTVGAVFRAGGRELRLVAVQPYQGRWLVHFAGVDTRVDAEALRGTVLEAPALDDDATEADEDVLWVHRLVGARVTRASDGEVLGTVASVLANPASDLLELDNGVLVPVRFVVEHRPGTVVVDVPEGLGE